MVFDDRTKEEFMEFFKAWLATKENVKALNAANRDMIKNLAEKYQIEKSAVAEAFNKYEKLFTKGKDTLEDVVDIFEAMKDGIEESKE